MTASTSAVQHSHLQAAHQEQRPRVAVDGGSTDLRWVEVASGHVTCARSRTVGVALDSMMV